MLLDKERNPRLTYRAQQKFKDETGIEIIHGLEIDKLDTEQMYKLIWCSLWQEDEALTFEEVGELVDLSRIGAVVREIMSRGKTSPPLASSGPGRKSTRTSRATSSGS